jgi:HEAT repeat protein
MIEFIGEEGLHQFAPLLNDALDDERCRAYAMTAAGQLRSEANLAAILKLAGDPAMLKWNRMLWALKDYAHPLCRPALERLFRTASHKQDRVIAAWGLGKLGDQRAMHYLTEMLDDPYTVTATEKATFYDPGESLRAAQALCDIPRLALRVGRQLGGEDETAVAAVGGSGNLSSDPE